MENIKLLLKKARSGSVEAQKELLVQFVSQSQEVVSLMNDDDKAWLMPLAQERNIYAICWLNYGASCKFEHWVDTLIDEDTGKDVPWDRYNLIDGSTFTLSDEEKDMLWEQIRGVENLSENEIRALRYSDFLYNHNLVKKTIRQASKRLVGTLFGRKFLLWS